jgi:hypothetical protein
MLVQSPNFLSGYDFQRTHLFYKTYFHDALLSGRLPLWNPYVGLGRPYMADIETASLYPANLLVLLFGVYGGTAVSVLLHQALAIYCGVRLGQKTGASAGASWLVGAGFALSSPFTARLDAGILQGYCALCWFPALLWLGASLQDRWEPRVAAGFAAAVGLTILAGHPPFAYLDFFGLAVFLACRQGWPSDRAGFAGAARNTLGLAAAGIIGVGLSCAALIPFLELVGQGNRPLDSAGFAVANGMPAASWLSLVVPASSSFRPNWEYGLHCGLVPLFAALGCLLLPRDRNVRGFLGMGAVGVLLAAGDRLPVLGWVAHVVPGSGALRIPSRYGILLSASILGLAAVALSRRRPLAVPVAAIGLAAGVTCVIWLEPRLVHGAGSVGGYYLSRAGALAAAAVLVMLWNFRQRPAPLLACALAVFCACNWLWAIRLQAPVYSQYGFTNDDAAVRAALTNAGLFGRSGVPPRISFEPSEVRENSGMVEGYSAYASYVAPSLGRTWAYLHEATGVPMSATDFVRIPEAVYERSGRLDGINLVATYDRGSPALLVRADPDPRAYVAFHVEAAADWREAERAMTASDSFHTRALAERGSEPAVAPLAGDPAGEAVITAFTPERVTVQAAAAAQGVLVLAEAWYPGWRATVDGAPAAVFPVNGWMRGVVVPAGRSEVEFTFRSRWLGVGAAISLAGAAAVFALWRRGRPGQTVSNSL